MGKTCCQSDAAKTTMVNVGGIKVGLIAVEEIFKKLSESSMTLTPVYIVYRFDLLNKNQNDFIY